MVLNYVSEGNLRNYLQKNDSNLTLKDRITMFYYLCWSLKDIHEKDIIHCDLHSGNILVQGCACFITDLGLCGPVDDESSNKIYGITSYIAPEVLRRNKKNTKEMKDTKNKTHLLQPLHRPYDRTKDLGGGGKKEN